MNTDPLESLNAFYEECHMAPVPEPRVRAPWWMRAFIPFGGLAFGGAIAGLLICMPMQGSQKVSEQVAHAVSAVQVNELGKVATLALHPETLTPLPPSPITNQMGEGIT